jgi:hypothetical protein
MAKNKFKNLNNEIEEILTSTFGQKVIVKQSFYEKKTSDQYDIWYFQYHNGAYETLISIPRCCHGTQCHTITDIEKFKKEFGNNNNKDAYLIFEDDVINCTYSLDVYQAFKFITALKEKGFELAEFDL